MRVVELTAAASAWLEYAESNPDGGVIGLTSAHLAYVIYSTSGSTWDA